MPDTFSIELSAKPASASEAWEAARVLTTTVEHVNPGGHSFRDDWWELEAEGRRWSRPTLKELEVLAAGLELKDPTLYWNYSVDGLQWRLVVYLWSNRSAEVELDAYAGADRMATEEAVRLVVKRAADRGVELKRGETEVSSIEGPRKKSTVDLVINAKPMKKWAMFRAWVGPHLLSYIVGTVASVTATILLFVVGFRG